MNCRGMGMGGSRGWILMAVGLLIAAGAALMELVPAHPITAANSQGERNLQSRVAPRASSGPPESSSLRLTYARLPLGFEANQGQSDARVKFLARGGGYGLFLTQEEAVLRWETHRFCACGYLDPTGPLRLREANEFPGKAITSSETIPQNGIATSHNSPECATSTFIRELIWSTTAIKGGWSTTLRSRRVRIPSRSRLNFEGRASHATGYPWQLRTQRRQAARFDSNRRTIYQNIGQRATAG